MPSNGFDLRRCLKGDIWEKTLHTFPKEYIDVVWKNSIISSHSYMLINVLKRLLRIKCDVFSKSKEIEKLKQELFINLLLVF